MRTVALSVTFGLLCGAGCLLLRVVWLLASEARRDRHPKRPGASCPIPTSQELVIDNLRRLYFEGQIESDEFEVRLWQAMTGASSPERIAEAEAIAASQPERDEVFRLMREARVRSLEESHT